MLERLRVAALGAALAFVPASQALAQTASIGTSLDRYFDASNAVTGGEIFGVPMPLSHGEPGAWKLTVAPAYVASSADPLKTEGFSLDMAYTRLFDQGWGLYLVGLGNYARTLSTSDSGTPNNRMLTDVITGVSDITYAGTQASGGSILTLCESAGASYNIHWDEPDRVPVTLFMTGVVTESYARDLDFGYTFSGSCPTCGYMPTSVGPYSLVGTSQNSLNAYFAGAVVGVSVEYKLGNHFLLRPHIFEVFLPYSKQTGTSENQYTQYCGGSACGSASSVTNVNSSLGVVYFPVPGVDLEWTDWKIGVNLVELAAGPLLKSESSDFLHGATVTSLRISYSFGTREVQLHPPEFPQKTGG